jgi:hypothetical protein
MAHWTICATGASILFGLLSAASWFRASFAKVSHEDATKLRIKRAEKRGKKPNLASASLDGWDMSETFALQTKWNAIGAAFAASSILTQTLVQLLD